ncbi:MAG: molybdate ABC transporter permease subunit [Candidatus Omnitrophica bacterium]|nr:molybdate ABC transporter permease subunit [Candidatus Omnitrophota bacterium]
MVFNLFNTELWSAVGLSLLCGLLSALLSIPWGIFWGWIFARKDFTGKIILQTLIYLPLVLPPVLTGYVLLMLLGRNAIVGKWLFDIFHLSFVLNWKGALLASVVVGSPFMVEAMRQSFKNIDERLEMVARGLGADSWKAFATITMPLARNGLIGGFFLVFARSIGEFGATIIIAGNIPNKTQTIPLAIFSSILNGEESRLWPLVLFAVIFSYAGLALNNFYHRQAEKGHRD